MSVLETPSTQDRLSKVSSILITQPRPSDDKSPYFDLARKYSLKIDFRPFIEVESVPLKEFRKQKIDIMAHTGIIFTSKNAVDNFFRIVTESKLELPPDMKYFCISEQTANYLHKYITVRKRKVFVAGKTASDMLDILKKHKNERFLFPCSDIRKNDIPDFMDNGGFQFTEAVLYRTVPSDLSGLADITYDIIAFFSPSGIASLFKNFPEFKQNNTRIAAFGPTTAKAVQEAGLWLDIEAPMPNAPSMTGALEVYIRKANGIN
jgi:uroporphyrinogen-III synthase